MEPTIYKPGAYKSPGIYNGAGGVYNGNGVYNDGAGNSKIWNMDIENLVLQSHTGDDGAKYTFSGSTFTKSGDVLTGQGNFNFSVNPPTRDKPVKEIGCTVVSYDYTTSAQFNFIGIGIAQIVCNESYALKYGTWLGKRTGENEWQSIGTLNYTSAPSGGITWKRYAGINMSFPNQLKLVKEGDKTVLYLGETILAQRVGPMYSGMTMNTGGNSTSKKISIKDVYAIYE